MNNQQQQKNQTTQKSRSPFKNAEVILLQQPPLRRQTHAYCIRCGKIVSYYSRPCWNCDSNSHRLTFLD